MERALATTDQNLQDLQAALARHVRCRGRDRPGSEPDCEVLQACCVTLLLGPVDLGLSAAPSPLPERTVVVLCDPRSAAVPEAEVCQWWLQCAGGDEGAAATRLAELAELALWGPVEALAYRALAYWGRRRTLARILSRKPPASPVRVEAWLEAATPHPIPLENRHLGLADHAIPHADEFLGLWVDVLAAEWRLAYQEQDAAAETKLWSVLGCSLEQVPSAFARSQCQRLQARALAALIRYRLGLGSDVMELLKHPAATSLPLWELEYLTGLRNWQLGENQNAVARLRRSLDLNAFQTCTRLGLASLSAYCDTEAALGFLEHAEPTRELFLTRSVILARMGRFDEAESALASAARRGDIGWEAVRQSWCRGRAQIERRERILGAALAERRGEWPAAEEHWQAACSGGKSKGLCEARRLWAVACEQTRLPSGRTWRHSVLRQRRHELEREIGNIPLVGEALFFRGLAMLETAPERASKDFRTLLRQRSWIAAEQTVGGQRLIVGGDALVRLGYWQEAVRAYELASPRTSASAQERLAVLSVLAAWRGGGGPDVVAERGDQAGRDVPHSPWVPAMTALALLLSGGAENASAYLDSSQQTGLPEPLVRALRAVARVLKGGGGLPAEALAPLQLPPELEALIGVACAPEDSLAEWAGRLAARLGDGWVAASPRDPAQVARSLLEKWCAEQDWEHVLKFTKQLEGLRHRWAVELAALVRLYHALQLAAAGNLDRAERELNDLDKELTNIPTTVV